MSEKQNDRETEALSTCWINSQMAVIVEDELGRKQDPEASCRCPIRVASAQILHSQAHLTVTAFKLAGLGMPVLICYDPVPAPDFYIGSQIC